MVSKTSLKEDVRAFRWRELADAFAARPDLLRARDDRGRTWLHLCCATPGGDAGDSIPTADLLLRLRRGHEDAPPTAGAWRRAPRWGALPWGRAVAPARHLVHLGSAARRSPVAARRS